MRIDFYPIDISHRTRDGTPDILLFGRTTDGKRICIIDDHFNAFFWVLAEQREHIHDLVKHLESIKAHEDKHLYYVTKTEVHRRAYLGQELDAIKVYTNDPRGMSDLKDLITDYDGVTGIKETDIIVALNQIPINEKTSVEDVLEMVPMGSTIEIKILRDGQEKTIAVTAEERIS